MHRDAPSLEDPLVLVRAWHADAQAHPAIRYAHSAVLATNAGDQPDARVVLIHTFGPRYLTFGTDSSSAKAKQLRHCPRAALVLYWEPLERQIRLRGQIETGDEAEADATFDDRPRESRITAWASRQSQPVAERSVLEARWQETAARFAGAEIIDRPSTWRAYRFVPHEIEAWQAGRYRLHHRRCFTIASEGRWQETILEP